MKSSKTSSTESSDRAKRIAAAAKAAIGRKAVKVPTIEEQKAELEKLREENAAKAAAAAEKVAERKRKTKASKTVAEAAADLPLDPRQQAASALARVIDRIAATAAIDELAKRIAKPSKKVDATAEAICQRVWPGAIAPLTAAVQRKTGARVLLLLPTTGDVDTLAADLAAVTETEVLNFPPIAEDSDRETLLQDETLSRLQVLTRLLDSTQPAIILSTLPAIMHAVPEPAKLFADERVIAIGKRVDLGELRKWLQRSGYVSTTAVQLPGEYTVRGGILDVYPPAATEPLRIELFDDEVDSIRSFDVISQRSIERLDSVRLATTTPIEQLSASFLDYLGSNRLIVRWEPPRIHAAAESFLSRVPFPQRFESVSRVESRLAELPTIDLVELADVDGGQPIVDSPIGDVDRVGGDLDKLADRVDAALGGERRGLVVCINEPEQARLSDLFARSEAYASGRLQLVISRLSAGFEVPQVAGSRRGRSSLPVADMVLTVTQLLKRTALPRNVRRAASRAIDSFLDLRPGDYVVHLSHGIGIYRGLKMIERLGQTHEHLEIEFDEGTKIYVPVTKIDLVQRYIGGTKSQPKLAKIGGQSWVRQKQAAEQAVTDMASELLELQAQRRSQPGIAMPADSMWQAQFEGSFPYEETPDQITAIAATKADQMQPRPMDRLICGDVGFGKTEVAMRAAFKAVDNGYQVAVLVPTTVLAEQHYRSFLSRLGEFPFDIGRLSRFCSRTEEREILSRIAIGNMDIVIGTHRLVSSDVNWYNLGLVIVDEEQRFGVAVKERLKRQRPNVDMMTLSATPIPRTLHMSLLGVRDISNLETAPQERLSVETHVIRSDDNIIRNAIRREIDRGGQVYFVHNRVHDMAAVEQRLQALVPDARIVVGHGQMNEHALERVMIDFIEHRFDILLATTIIESGLDIPNANTIFIDDADHYGLAELHQLRGRVGRYKHQAYCYLLIPRHKHLNPDAARRMHAIEEYSEIGAGFGIAMRDLEIRGAGNLLGTQQSGHIAAVGYELYCQLLESAVRSLRQEPPKLSIDVDVNLPLDAYLPGDYVPEMRHKIDLYRRISRLESDAAIADLRAELTDRFGPIPDVVARLLTIARLRIEATLWSVRSIAAETDHLVMTYSDRRRIEQLAVRHKGQLKLYGIGRAYWPILSPDEDLLKVAMRVFSS